MAQEIRGRVKRASGGQLVAEVWSGEMVRIGDTVTVAGVTSNVVDRGRNFKRNGYGFCYLYLSETAAEGPIPDPVAPSARAPRPLSAWEAAMVEQARRQEREDAEDRGELEITMPGGIEVGHE